MDKELKGKWLTALRSGEYRQTVGILRRTGADGPYYCCIGVLLTVAGKPCKGTTIRGDQQEEVGLDDAHRLRLENLNDGKVHPEANPRGERHSFAQIADYIEANI